MKDESSKKEKGAGFSSDSDFFFWVSLTVLILVGRRASQRVVGEVI